MSRCFYYLHRYGDKSHRPFATFTSRKALRTAMKNLPYSAEHYEENFFLHVLAPRYTAIYNFKAHDGNHLSAVLSRKTLFSVDLSV